MGGRSRRCTSRPGPTNRVPKALPGILRKLRGEWPCVPFGYSVSADGWPDEWAQVMGRRNPNEEVHGHSSNHDWTWLESDGHSLSLALDYPVSSPVAACRKDCDARPGRAGDRHRVQHRGAPCLPPADRAASRLPPADRRQALPSWNSAHSTMAAPIQTTSSPARRSLPKDATFADLTAVPARAGGTVDASRLPLAVDDRGTAAGRGARRHGRACQPRRRLSRKTFLAEGAFPEPAALVFQPRPQGLAVERPPRRHRHRADLLAFRARPGNRPCRQSDRADPASRRRWHFVPERPFTTRYRIEASPL